MSSSYASLLVIISSVFLLATAQLAIVAAEMRVSRMHEKHSGLYDIGVSVAEAKLREVNRIINDMDMAVIKGYMEGEGWETQCELKDGVFLLSGKAFYKEYQDIAKQYVGFKGSERMQIAHESGVEVDIYAEFNAIGTKFTITVTNAGQRPSVSYMAGTVKIEGVISWNAEPPVYYLKPKFNFDPDTLGDRAFGDFTVSRAEGFSPLVLSELRRV